MALMAPATKQSTQVTIPAKIPQQLAAAFRDARAGCPGPVYLDLPGDVLFAQVDEEQVCYPAPSVPSRALADPGRGTSRGRDPP